MGPEIEAANQHVIKIFNDLKEKYNEQKNFQFGVVFYRDQIYAKSDNVKKYYVDGLWIGIIILKEMNLDFFN